MEKGGKLRYALSGAAAGLTNGFFGGGGGSVLVPLLTRVCGLSQRQAFATSVAVILPLCVLSAAIYLFRGGLDLTAALPYLIGGAAGGWLGGKSFRGMNMPPPARPRRACRPGGAPRGGGRPGGPRRSGGGGAAPCCWCI